MASATARVNSLLTCQCLAKTALKSHSPELPDVVAIPARKNRADKPINVAFIGFSSASDLGQKPRIGSSFRLRLPNWFQNDIFFQNTLLFRRKISHLRD